MCGWGNILTIPEDATIPTGPSHSIIMHYGQVTLEQIRAHATNYNNAQTCAAQNKLMLDTCLIASIHQRAAHGKFFYRSQVFLMYLPGIPGNFIKIIDFLLRMLKNFLSPPPKFEVCRLSSKNFCYDGNPLAVVGNNLGISVKIITFASTIINFLMTLMKDSSRSWIVVLSLSCGLCTATHVKVTIIFFWGCNQVAKCSVSAVPETNVAKQAIFLQILHAHPTINHFIAS